MSLLILYVFFILIIYTIWLQDRLDDILEFNISNYDILFMLVCLPYTVLSVIFSVMFLFVFRLHDRNVSENRLDKRNILPRKAIK